ncbi:HalOD1 output domain-containing protein [Haloarcula amylovorans]|uniref:HalOD1 output domain-containing protein n=1 Tax=Haloarcula amylovorans TaxID=2562280 RepID=UPI001431457C|nr:HalOD1 output domain-containing protein [Halomicroarcula amylolytica]
MDDNTDHRNPSTAPTETDESRFEWEPAENPCTAVIEAVTASTTGDSADLPPLYNTVDPDALSAILAERTTGSGSAIRVSFEYAGTDVTIDSHGGIVVRSIETRND